jgi:glucose dehydrogenase
VRVILILVSAGVLVAQQYTWNDYAGAVDGAQYSALKQVDRSTVGRLELAWFYPAPGAGASMDGRDLTVVAQS